MDGAMVLVIMATGPTGGRSETPSRSCTPLLRGSVRRARPARQEGLWWRALDPQKHVGGAPAATTPPGARRPRGHGEQERRQQAMITAAMHLGDVMPSLKSPASPARLPAWWWSGRPTCQRPLPGQRRRT